MVADPLEDFRHSKDDFFRTSRQSPLLPDQQASFGGLSYYAYNPDLIFELVPEEFARKASIRMQTSTGDVRSFVQWGKVIFSVEGQEASLVLYATPGEPGFFVPFMDATTGEETYGAGRYLDIEARPGGKIHLDFNLAYNPWCAYSPYFSCPLPPAENRLKVPIRAGEKKPEGEWVPEE